MSIALKTHHVDAAEVVECGRVFSKRLPFLVTAPRYFFWTDTNYFGIVLVAPRDESSSFLTNLDSATTLEYARLSLIICDADLALLCETAEDGEREKQAITDSRVLKKRELQPAEAPELSARYTEFFGEHLRTHYAVDFSEEEAAELRTRLRECYKGKENSRDELWSQAMSHAETNNARHGPIECHLATLGHELLQRRQQAKPRRDSEKEETTGN